MAIEKRSSGNQGTSAESKGGESQQERVTVLATELAPAALEFHRKRLGDLGYSIEGPITRHKFYMANSSGETTEMFDGEPYYAATFVRRGDG